MIPVARRDQLPVPGESNVESRPHSGREFESLEILKLKLVRNQSINFFERESQASQETHVFGNQLFITRDQVVVRRLGQVVRDDGRVTGSGSPALPERPSYSELAPHQLLRQRRSAAPERRRLHVETRPIQLVVYQHCLLLLHLKGIGTKNQILRN